MKVRAQIEKQNKTLEYLPSENQDVIKICNSFINTGKIPTLPSIQLKDILDVIITSFATLEKYLSKAISTKQDVTKELSAATLCQDIYLLFIRRLYEKGLDVDSLYIAKKFRKHSLIVDELIQQGKEAGLITDPGKIASQSSLLVDINTILVNLSVKLKYTHRTFAYIDESLSALNKTLNTQEALRKAKYFFNSVAAEQFFASNDLDSALRFASKSVKNHKWNEDKKFVTTLTDLLRALLKTKETKYHSPILNLCKILKKTEQSNLVKFAMGCEETIRNRHLKEQDKSAITQSVVDEVKQAQQKSTLVTIPQSTMVNPLPQKTTSTTTMIRTLGDELKSEQLENQSPKEKVKTRKNQINTVSDSKISNNNDIPPPPPLPISDAEKYGFDESFSDEKIYELSSKLIPEGTYYAIYPKKNLETELLPGLHKKNMEILEDGRIGADGNRVRYNKKEEDSFKIGKKSSNNRWFSRIAQVIWVNGKRKVLLSFEAKRNHNTQQEEYAKKPSTR